MPLVGLLALKTPRRRTTRRTAMPIHEAGQLVKHSRCLAPGRPDSHRGADQEDGQPKNLLSSFDTEATAAPFGTPIARFRIPKKRKRDTAPEGDAPEQEPSEQEAPAATGEEDQESHVDSPIAASEYEEEIADPFSVDAEDHAVAAAASYEQLLGRSTTGEPCVSENERATARERASERASERRAPSEANEHATSERERSAKS